MPSKRSARVGVRRRHINAPLRTRARTFITKARNLIASNDLDSAEQAARDAIVALDKAAQRGVIHRNNAARRKSRILKRLHAARGG